MSFGLCSFDESSFAEQLGEDGKDAKTYLVTLSESFTDETGRLAAGMEVAVKTFKPTKSVNKIKKEVEYQTTCSKAQISPYVYGVNYETKYITMQRLQSLPAKDYHGLSMPEPIQYMICALMGRLDDVGILHGDMNALNVMLDSNGRPYMIDFGFAKKITTAVRKKHGPHPNITVSLWGLAKGFKHHRVAVPILQQCLQQCKSGHSIAPYIEKGETLLASCTTKRKRKRK